MTPVKVFSFEKGETGGSSPLCRELIRSIILSSLPHVYPVAAECRVSMYLSIESVHRFSPQHSHRMCIVLNQTSPS